MFTRHRDFLEKTLHRLSESMEQANRADDSSVAPGLLQRLDPRGKLVGLLALVFAAATSQKLGVTAAIFALGLVLACASGKAVVAQIAKLWGGVFFFTGAVVLPAMILVPGPALIRLPWLGWAVTEHGLHSALALIARAETTATLASLLVVTTRWGHLLKALLVLRVPVLFVVLLGMTYRFLFVLLNMAHAFFEARRVRRVGPLAGWQRREMAVSSAAVLLSKSVQLSGEVYEAMQARGFRGEAHTLEEFRMKRLDWCFLASLLALAGAACKVGAMP